MFNRYGIHYSVQQTGLYTEVVRDNFMEPRIYLACLAKMVLAKAQPGLNLSPARDRVLKKKERGGEREREREKESKEREREGERERERGEREGENE